MNRSLFKVILAAVFILTSAAFAQASVVGQNSIEGLWLSKKKDLVVKISSCDKKLCGSIFWLRDDVVKTDKKGKALCGAQVLSGFQLLKNKEGLVWANGTIYQLAENKTYSAHMKLRDAQTLELRAYVFAPAFGKTKIFTRTSKKFYQDCAAHTLKKTI